MNTIIEDDLDSIFGDDPGHSAQGAAQQMAAQSPQPTVFPLALAEGTLPASAPTPTGIRRQVAGMPIWGWALVAAGVGVGGYYYYQQSRGVKSNPDGGDSDGGDSDSAGSAEERGWSPSRSRFADMLRRFFSKANMADRVTIYHDADDAKKAKIKHVSPLVTVVAKGQLPMKELERMSRREGLKPMTHEGGVVGFYPIQGKRGRAWEEYIDLLRDDGQTV